ncbi:MAG: DUF2254 domain-containing protein [Actinomycetota bacterium]|jgi:uncharacterized membrane protein|nr:DUF2254 domain-containing protein [Actinomycetota bacterium]
MTMGGSSGGKLGSFREKLKSSFWFVPALFVLGAVVLFSVTQYLDQIVRTNLAFLPVVFSGGPSAARSVLSSIAGSLITTVTTAFSLTIVTLQLASSSYTPRVMRSFTSDRGVQVVLGMFIATFLYSLLVLRIIREAQAEGASFTPVISVTVAVVLTVVCVGLLIYFIAHVVNLIQSSTIVEMARQDALEVIANLDDLADAPSRDPEPPEDRTELRDLLSGEPLVIRARQSGYVQYLNADEVVEAVVGGGGASGRGTTVVEVPFGPGHFVAAGLPLVRVWPAKGPQSEADVYDAFYFGKERSFRQDFAFGLRQLSDIALKGLSPGVNDPTTAMQAMDQMEAMFVALGEKAMPPRVQEKEVGDAKVVLKVAYYSFDNVVGLAFDQIRRASFTSGQVAVLERYIEIVGRAIDANESSERRCALWVRAFSVARLAPSRVSDPWDAANLVLKAVEIGEKLVKAGVDVASDLQNLSRLSEDLPGGERVREAVQGVLRRSVAR